MLTLTYKKRVIGEMYVGLKEVYQEEIISMQETVANQLAFFERAISNPILLLQEMHTLASEFNEPCIFQVLRMNHSRKGVKDLETKIEKSLEMYIREHFKGKGNITIKKKRARDMLHSLQVDEVEIVRFLLMSKEFTFMYNMIGDCKKLEKSLSTHKKNLEQMREGLDDLVRKKEQAELLATSNRAVLKKARNMKEKIQLIVNMRKIKKVQEENVIVYSESIDAEKKRIDEYAENEKLIRIKYERDKALYEELKPLMESFGYQYVEDWKNFYL